MNGRRRTWEHRAEHRLWGFEKGEGNWDNDFIDFTPTYSEAEAATIEGVIMKIVLNGLMCGFPVCCVLNYASRWFQYAKTGDERFTKNDRIASTPTGQPYAECESAEHEWIGIDEPVTEALYTTRDLSKVEE